ncbi:hypothetical protein [Phenylobacterium sp.]|uniref:hypothetical protein n=1 Tax=Phenylobacterium sp. TaxID=1871053 RepID=UPI0028997AEC|nr:hypothetical protein [Phenylobacterium sp.]
MSGFWRTWMAGWCWAVAAFGALLAGGAVEATSGPVRLLLEVLNGPAVVTLDDTARFSLAVLGAVTIGWSLTLLAAIDAACRLGAQGRPIWRLIAISLAVWYVIDCVLSVVTGFGLNVIPNTVLTAAFLPPIVGLLRRPSAAFHSP